jgi:hypothetical protein
MMDEARRANNLAVLGWFVDRRDGSHLTGAQGTDALDPARAERDAQLGHRETDAQ